MNGGLTSQLIIRPLTMVCECEVTLFMPIIFVSGIPYSDELFHYGIKGQKWGVRRFQNEDMSLTPAGRERYSKSSFNASRNGSFSKEKARNAAKTAGIIAGTALAAYGAYRLANSDIGKEFISRQLSKRKEHRGYIKDAARVHSMSLNELEEKMGRLQKEKSFVELTLNRLTTTGNPDTNMLIRSGRKVMEGLLVGTGTYAGYAILSKKFDPKQYAGYAFANPNKKK